LFTGPRLAVKRSKLLKPFFGIIFELNSDQFKTREAAVAELEKLAEAAEPAIEKEMAAAISLELRRRLELLLDKLDGTKFPPETLRQIQAAEVLEHIGTARGGQVTCGPRRQRKH
jgi:hypothetical protein